MTSPIPARSNHNVRAQLLAIRSSDDLEKVRTSYRLIIIIHGGCRNNGYANSIGASAVVFIRPDGSIHHSTHRMPARPNPTNHRAELDAMILALGLASQEWTPAKLLDVRIYSESQYAIHCSNIWSQSREDNGTLRHHEQPVDNRDYLDLASGFDRVLRIVGKVEYVHTGRDQTWKAHTHCNHELDTMQKEMNSSSSLLQPSTPPPHPERQANNSFDSEAESSDDSSISPTKANKSSESGAESSSSSTHASTPQLRPKRRTNKFLKSRAKFTKAFIRETTLPTSPQPSSGPSSTERDEISKSYVNIDHMSVFADILTENLHLHRQDRKVKVGWWEFMSWEKRQVEELGFLTLHSWPEIDRWMNKWFSRILPTSWSEVDQSKKAVSVSS